MDRRAAIDACKERKSVAGIYALRVGGEIWVGGSPDIDRVWNRLSFSLRSGRHPRRALQAAWNRDGAAVFETLERLPEAPSAYVRDAALKERGERWRLRLGASAV